MRRSDRRWSFEAVSVSLVALAILLAGAVTVYVLATIACRVLGVSEFTRGLVVASVGFSYWQAISGWFLRRIGWA